MASFFKISLRRLITHSLFALFCGVLGALVASYFGLFYPGPVNWLGVMAGFLTAALLISIEYLCRRTPASHLLCGLFGMFVGLMATKIFFSFFVLMGFNEDYLRGFSFILFLLLSYFSTWALIYSQEHYQFAIPFVRLHTADSADRDIILDTSVIIDGRIADMCNTTFLNGRLIIPRFVLKELQAIADSSDSLKRNRGRRGLEILNKVKENSRLTVKIHEMDFPEINTVDAKLVKLASTINGRIFTNDYNLGKVAELQNIEVLNINELANVLKPVVLPGELMEVKIIKEGKESTQGVAYLDDGTMVVVENGRKLIGKSVRVVVTSAYQTQAGRMIFAKCE